MRTHVLSVHRKKTWWSQPLGLVALLLGFASPVWAQSSTLSSSTITSIGNIETMFANASGTWVALMNLVVGVSAIMGVALCGIGLLKMRELGDGRMSVKTPIMFVIVGALMYAMPASIDTMTETLSLGTNTGTALLSQSATSSLTGASLTGVLLFIKLIGHIAFARGLWVLKKNAEGDQHAGLGKGFFYIIGGAMSINIEATTAMLAATFFTGLTLPGGLGSL